MTHAELLKMAGRRAIRRRPTFGPADRTREPAPSMAPSRGYTPEISGTGRKSYVYHDGDRVAYAFWSDGRLRVPVQWVTLEQWRELPRPD